MIGDLLGEYLKHADLYTKVRILLEDASSIESEIDEFFSLFEIHYDDLYDWTRVGPLSEEQAKAYRHLMRRYESWYQEAHILIKQYYPEKEKEFVELHEGKMEDDRRPNFVGHKVTIFTGISDLIQLKFNRRYDRQEIIQKIIGLFTKQQAILIGISATINIIEKKEENTYDTTSQETNAVAATSASQLIERLFNRFQLVARELQNRWGSRSVFKIENEYDVQDLLRSLLKIFFDDIRPEEWTPSYAGSSSRMDFLLKDEGIVIETKKTRKNHGDKEIGEELIIDIAHYSQHADCKTLICFVYDPEGFIKNPRGLESDLSKSSNPNISVKVFIRPSG